LSQKATDLGIAHLVTFTGFRDDRLDFLRGFDALVLPSVLEGIPRCLMEGMAAGVPVIGTDIPGTRDLVEHGRTGWLFPVGDSAALAAALDGILKDRAATSAIVAGARESVSTRFSAAVMSARYQTLFKNVTAGTFTGRNTRPGERGGG
jgi:glycosyltransferase involved in cell wall biosynthesis